MIRVWKLERRMMWHMIWIWSLKTDDVAHDPDLELKDGMMWHMI